MNRLALITSSILVTAGARAADDADVAGALEEIIVTAEKHAENLQQVPISVEALDTRELEQLLATSFDGYAKYLPSLGSVNFGPGQEQPYIRGVTNDSVGLRVGSQPTVAIYLDEQPVTTIADNLDVHIYDIARVEELSGPQGTLFGASSMAGTLRIITNKPSTAGFEAGYTVDANTMPAGSPGGRLEGYVNLPVSQQAAIRLVGFTEHDGGYINNVLGPPETWPTSGVIRTNAGLTKKHFNDVTTSGGRGALKLDLADSWTVLPTVIGQQMTANGIPAYSPALGDLNVARYFPDRDVDRWWQAALTVEGKIANFDVVYAGAYLNRTVQTQSDYSQYYYDLDVAYQATPQYYGDHYRDDAGNLIAPAVDVLSSYRYEKVSHELRVSSPQDWRLRFVAGLFLQHQLDDTRDEFRINDLAASLSVTGYPGLEYLNAMSRVDRDRAAFGELSYDLTRKLTLTAGLREFSYDNTVYGFFGYPSTEVLCEPGSLGNAGPGRPCIDVNQRATKSGSTYKFNLTYHVDADRMLYTTWSTGFRPGGINRTRDILPYGPDYLVNYEAGWKTEWLGHRLRYNGALFYEGWKNPQFTICGPNCVYEVINAGGARIRGIENELQWSLARGLTLSAAVTWLDAKLTANACVYGNAGSLCKNSAGVADPTVLPAATAGDPLPASKFKGNLIARYAFKIGDLRAHAQAAAVAQSSLPTGLPSVGGGLQAGNAPGYASLDLSGGLGHDGWDSELYLKNALDSRAELNRALICGLPSCSQLYVMPIPPRTIGMTFRQKF
ncbi:MAG: TonB-dependent receptor [Steroidobacterales bacterium]